MNLPKSTLDFLLTLWLHHNQNHTVKLDYVVVESFTFFGIDERKYWPKSANTAYALINGNRAYTCTTSDG